MKLLRMSLYWEVRKMIMLHSGFAEEIMRVVEGYAVREEGGVYIILADGTKMKVRRETVRPCYVRNRIEDYIHLTDKILLEFHKKGIYYLEDIAELSDGKLGKIRGVGEVRRKAIRKIVEEELGTEYKIW